MAFTTVSKKVHVVNLGLARRSKRNCSPLAHGKLRLTTNRSCIGREGGQNGGIPSIHLMIPRFCPLLKKCRGGVSHILYGFGPNNRWPSSLRCFHDHRSVVVREVRQTKQATTVQNAPSFAQTLSLPWFLLNPVSDTAQVPVHWPIAVHSTAVDQAAVEQTGRLQDGRSMFIRQHPYTAGQTRSACYIAVKFKIHQWWYLHMLDETSGPHSPACLKELLPGSEAVQNISG